MPDLEIIRQSDGFESRPDRKPLLKKPLKYDKGFEVNKDTGLFKSFYKDDDVWKTMGQVAQDGMKFGLPNRIEGSPLGCGCEEAYLHGVGDITPEGHIEADYVCDSGWHNFVVFQLGLKERPTQIRIDKNGDIIEKEDDYQPTQLGEM